VQAIRENGLWLTALLTVAVFLGLGIFAEFGAIVDAFRDFQWWVFGAVLGFATVGYGVRFLKWELYLRELGVDVPLRSSLLVFFSGLMLVVTPGKAGELWKAWFMRDLEDVPVSQVSSVVGAERITDLIALSAMAFSGLVVFGRSFVALVAVALVFVVGILLLQWRTFCLGVLERLEALPVVDSYAEDIERFYESTYTLFQLRPLVLSTVLSLVAWGLEGIALWLVLDGFGVSSTIATGMFVFGLGSVIGAVSLLPGGLGAAEASMASLLVSLGYARSIAVSTTLIIRVGTLWYAALLGTVVFLGYKLYTQNYSIQISS